MYNAHRRGLNMDSINLTTTAKTRILLAGLAGTGIAAVLLAALVAAPIAPLVALGLATFAENKVQGLANSYKVGYSASQRANVLTATCMAGVSG